MKKKIFIFIIFALLISFILRVLARINRVRISGNIIFTQPNGSHVNARTVLKKPGQ